MKAIVLLTLASLLANELALAKPLRSAAKKAQTDAALANLGASFPAAVEVADEELRIVLPPELRDKVRGEKWDALAFVYHSDERPPYKSAYLLQDRGDYYLLTTPYPRQRAWTLEIILAPPKGESLVTTLHFFDRNPLEDRP